MLGAPSLELDPKEIRRSTYCYRQSQSNVVQQHTNCEMSKYHRSPQVLHHYRLLWSEPPSQGHDKAPFKEILVKKCKKKDKIPYQFTTNSNYIYPIILQNSTWWLPTVVILMSMAIAWRLVLDAKGGGGKLPCSPLTSLQRWNLQVELPIVLRMYWHSGLERSSVAT